MATPLGLEKFERIEFSFWRWVTRGKKRPNRWGDMSVKPWDLSEFFSFTVVAVGVTFLKVYLVVIKFIQRNNPRNFLAGANCPIPNAQWATRWSLYCHLDFWEKYSTAMCYHSFSICDVCRPSHISKIRSWNDIESKIQFLVVTSISNVFKRNVSGSDAVASTNVFWACFFFIDFVLFVSKLLFLDLICEFITFCIDFVLFIFEFLFLELIFEFILQPFNLSVTWELGCFLCIIQACRVDVMWSRLIIKELSLGKKQTDISPAFATVWHHHHNNILREGITPKIKDFLSNISNNYDHNFEFYFCFGQVVAENKHVFFLHFFRLVWTSSLLAMVEFVALS